MAGNTLDFAALLRWLAARYSPSQRCVAMFFNFLFFYFLLDNCKREKEWEKEKSFETCSLVSWLHCL